MGAVDPLAATQEQNRSFEHVRLAAAAPTVTIRVLNSAPRSITILDEAARRLSGAHASAQLSARERRSDC